MLFSEVGSKNFSQLVQHVPEITVSVMDPGGGPRGRSLGGGPRRKVPGVPEPPFSSCLTPKFSLQQDCKLLVNMKNFKSTDLEIFFSSFKL